MMLLALCVSVIISCNEFTVRKERLRALEEIVLRQTKIQFNDEKAHNPEDERARFIPPITVECIGPNFDVCKPHKEENDGSCVLMSDIVEMLFSVCQECEPEMGRLYINTCESLWDTEKDFKPDDDLALSFVNAMQLIRMDAGQVRTIFGELSAYMIHGIRKPESLEPGVRAKCQLAMYTVQRERGGPYKIINEYLQGKELVRVVDNYSDALVRVVCKAFRYLFYQSRRANVKIPKAVWRGMHSIDDERWAAFEVGKEFYWASFVSTSLKRKVAEEFTKKNEKDEESDKDSVLFEIETNDSAFALSLEGISVFEEEKEILFYPYHKFKVMYKNANTKETGFRGRGIIQLKIMHSITGIEKSSASGSSTSSSSALECESQIGGHPQT